MPNQTIRKTFTFNGTRYTVRAKTEAEAIKKMALKQRDLEEGKVVLNSNMSVRDWAEKAVDIYKTNQAEITRKKYVNRMNHCILEHIGSYSLQSIKPIQCQEVLNLQLGNSKAQINVVYQQLQFIFRTAKQNQLIATNPAEYIVRPSGTVTERRSITDFEREHFLSVCEDHPEFTIFLAMLYCGLRPSEARALMGHDIKEIDGVKVLHIRGTKTEKADRTVPLLGDLYEKIKDTPKFQYVFTRNGKPYTPETFSRLTNQLYRQMNISMGCKVYRNKLVPPFPLADDFVPYDLRHTYCTDLQKAGIDIRVASYLMGHSDIQITNKIYTHQDNSTILEAAKLLSNKTDSSKQKVSQKCHICL